MTVFLGVEGQLISEARIFIYNDIKALNQRCSILSASVCKFMADISIYVIKENLSQNFCEKIKITKLKGIDIAISRSRYK